MKLHHLPGTCSSALHIVSREAFGIEGLVMTDSKGSMP